MGISASECCQWGWASLSMWCGKEGAGAGVLLGIGELK